MINRGFSIIAIILVLISPLTSFGMIADSNNSKEKVLYGDADYPVSLEDILKYKQAEDKREALQSLKPFSKKKHDKSNLIQLYKNQEPQFVSDFLSSRNVPVVIIDMSPPVLRLTEQGALEEVAYFTVSPYEKSFYSNPAMKFIDTNQKMAELGQEKLKIAFDAFRKKRMATISPEHRETQNFTCYKNLSNPLVSAALFGKDENVLQVLNLITTDYFLKHRNFIDSTLAAALVASIKSYNKQNKAFELLLLKLKSLSQEAEQLSQQKGEYFSRNCTLSYNLLHLVAHNKELFALLSQIDPYSTNQHLWGDDVFSSNVDRMFQDVNFDQENIKIYRDNGGMTMVEIGVQNIELLYKDQDPVRVFNRLLSAYVPIICIEISPTFTRENEKIYYYIIDPYEKLFYSNPDEQYVDTIAIKDIAKKRFSEMNCRWNENRKKSNSNNIEVFLENSQPLMRATLFGDNKDIKKELKNGCSDQCLYSCVTAAIKCPHEKNDALELLLLELRSRHNSSDDRNFKAALNCSYHLLLLAADNKQAFELIATIDPYQANRLCWQTEFGNYSFTNLDRMLEDKNFDQENIRIFRDNYGLTTQEWHNVQFIEMIVQNLPDRNVALTIEQEDQLRRLDSLPLGHYCKEKNENV